MLSDFILDHIQNAKRPVCARELVKHFKTADFAVEDALATLHAWGHIKQYVTTSGTFFEYNDTTKEKTEEEGKSTGGLTLDFNPVSISALKSFRERSNAQPTTQSVSALHPEGLSFEDWESIVKPVQKKIKPKM